MEKDSFNLEQLKSSRYGEYFSHLQNITEKQVREILLNKKVNQILVHDYRKEINKLLSELLEYFREDQYSSIRFVVKRKNIQQGEVPITEGIGVNCSVYTYLDNQIEDQLGKPGILYISDTTRIHSIKFASGGQFPKTILGLSLGNGIEKLGLIWFACDQQKNFTKFESDSLVTLVEACITVIQQCIEWNKITFNLSFRNEILNLVNFPIFILTKNAVIFSNLATEQVLKKNLVEKKENKDLIRKIWELKIGENGFIKLHNRDYQIVFIESIQNYRESFRAAILLDDTISQLQKEYISLVIDSLSQGLRAPLNLILGSIKMLPLVGDVNDNQKNYLDSIQIKTNESLVIIEELLDLKRVMKNNGLKIQSIDVKSLIDISISLVIHLAKQKRIAIINKSSNSNELINVDKVLFTQALANILEFAVSQTVLGGEVDCYFDIQIEKCQLTINDRSNGLSQVEVDKLNSYENLHDMPSGLLLVRSIINFHGGTFKIQSDLGKGNTYILEIPKK